MSKTEEVQEQETSLLDCKACNNVVVDHTCALKGLQDMFPNVR